MSLALMVLVVVLVGMLVFLIVAMLMPLRIELVLTKHEAWRYKAACRAFGRFGPRISLSGHKAQAQEPQTSQSARRLRGRTNLLRVIRAGARFGVDILHRAKFDAARLDMQFGTGDPAETGHIFGMLTPVIYGTVASSRLCLTVEPDFDQAILRGRVDLDLSVVPARLLLPAARFGWSVFGPKR
ncbi:DUF2953 domain-containing protein [uncultured Tateyamaria sp.]|uniref:DUF2953 domain-containing protein n=1 Tax=uncultured Tateyamaria sp. TaxID=455651 RepID=UPI002633C4EE|nr:DUF2953 domain-containing protein [uncultured Tateyamaria sp.]